MRSQDGFSSAPWWANPFFTHTVWRSVSAFSTVNPVLTEQNAGICRYSPVLSVISPIAGWPLTPLREARLVSHACMYTMGTPGQGQAQKNQGVLRSVVAWLLPWSGILRQPAIFWVSGTPQLPSKASAGPQEATGNFLASTSGKAQTNHEASYSTDKSSFQAWQAIFPHNSFLWCSDLVLWKVQFFAVKFILCSTQRVMKQNGWICSRYQKCYATKACTNWFQKDLLL